MCVYNMAIKWLQWCHFLQPMSLIYTKRHCIVTRHCYVTRHRIVARYCIVIRPWIVTWYRAYVFFVTKTFSTISIFLKLYLSHWHKNYISSILIRYNLGIYISLKRLIKSNIIVMITHREISRANERGAASGGGEDERLGSRSVQNKKTSCKCPCLLNELHRYYYSLWRFLAQ